MGQAQGSTRAADTPAEPAPEPKKGIPGMIEKCVGAGKNVAGTGVGAVGAVGGAAVGGVKSVGGAGVDVLKAGGSAFANLGPVGKFQEAFGAIDKSDKGLAKAFKSVDADGSGKINSAEMKAYIEKTYGSKMDDKVINEMMTAADTNKDGEVDLDEFKAIMRAGPKMKTDGVGGVIGSGAGVVTGGVGAVTGGVGKVAGAGIGGVKDVGGAGMKGAQAVGGAGMKGVQAVGGVAAGGIKGVGDTFKNLGAAAGFQAAMGVADKSDKGLEKAFKSVDADGSGKISDAEMKAHIKKTYGEALDDKMVKEMMAKADTNKDGEVDLEEFKVIMRAGPEKVEEKKGWF